MTSDNLRTLVRYRLEQADEALGAAQILLDQHSLRAVVNRAYYAMFYAVLALLPQKEVGMAREYRLMSSDGHLEVPPERRVHRVPEKYVVCYQQMSARGMVSSAACLSAAAQAATLGTSCRA